MTHDGQIARRTQINKLARRNHGSYHGPSSYLGILGLLIIGELHSLVPLFVIRRSTLHGALTVRKFRRRRDVVFVGKAATAF